MESTPLSTKVYEGRTVYLPTYWWVKMTDYPKNQLFCVHYISLTAQCEDCND